MCEIYSKSTMKTPERRHWCCSSVFVVKSEQVSYIVLVFLLLTFNKSIPTEKGGHTYQHSPAETTYIITLTQFSPVLRFTKKPVICFAEQNEWLVSKSNATLNWNRLTYQHSPAETTYIITLTHFSTVLRFMKKPVIYFAEQNEWLVSISNAKLVWNGLSVYWTTGQ